ncbi:response regulator [Ramlibacter algicola]|uniref:histidine kinase n=1 Tax=Ramlibacter algicola TaxID=2795217 RepID=A0A934PV55_9BURK|nr:response regulator [Ramlibacter algicola]MBK0391039.1 response regulator [Ramlibacter algicola]
MNEHLPENGSHERDLKVLLLEDSRFDAELLRETLLGSYPHAQLQVVRDEPGFVGALASGRYDVILSDYEIPGFSGDQALIEARAKNPRVPFIFVSGVIGEDNAVEMLKRGATDYVSKGRLVRLPLVIDRALREVSQREAREAAQVQLREANAVFARVVDSLRNYAVVLTDVRGTISSWNQAASEIFLQPREQMIGANFEVLFTPEDREAGVPRLEMAQALAHGKADDNRWMMRSDGLRLWAEGVVTPLYNDAGEHSGFSKIVRDATADYRDAEALRTAKEEAERASQAKDRFLAVLSHELRTPLSPIATAAHLLERTATVPPKYANLLPMIQRNVALEARLIEDLLDLTAISAGKVHLKPKTVDMHALVHVVLDMLDAQRRDKGIDVQLELRAPVPLVQADEARMQQVLWNLLRNAMKFSSDGGRVEVRTWQDDGQFVLEVADNGIGIEPEALPRIFSAFEQADLEVSQRFGGLGLGLAIARGLVAEHRGELTVSSAGRGQGATFTLRLRSQAADSAVQTVGHDRTASNDGGWKLLLVEDNQDAAETVVMFLESYGYQVTHVATCADAIRTAQRGTFDIVLTDLGLPDGSGIDVGRALSKSLPVVALSGYGATPDLQRSAMAGFAGHLVKPAEPQAIHAALQKALASRTAARPAVPAVSAAG